MPVQASRFLPLAAAALVLAACSDGKAPLSPSTPDRESPAPMISLTCTASTQSLSVRCNDPGPAGGARPVIVGGQHTYVTLTSSNVQMLADTFAFDVTVTNLIPQMLGSLDGSTAAPLGVRVFFAGGPVSTGSGTVTVANPDGTATFTAAGQPYYQYAGGLAQNSTSAAKRWKLRLSPEVTSFTFTVLVDTDVQYPDGYIDGHYYVLTLNPGESRTLPGTVRNFVGVAQPGQTITWEDVGQPGIVSVAGSQVTADGGNGVTFLAPQSGELEGDYATAVSVCPSVTVTSGTSLPSSIASTDCFSSYGGAGGLPTTDFYADLYRVALTAGQTITVTLNSGNTLDTYLLLAGPTSGRVVAENNDDNDGILGVGSKIVYTATVSGVYVIEASTLLPRAQGAYTLGVTIS